MFWEISKRDRLPLRSHSLWPKDKKIQVMNQRDGHQGHLSGNKRRFVRSLVLFFPITRGNVDTLPYKRTVDSFRKSEWWWMQSLANGSLQIIPC